MQDIYLLGQYLYPYRKSAYYLSVHFHRSGMARCSIDRHRAASSAYEEVSLGECPVEESRAVLRQRQAG